MMKNTSIYQSFNKSRYKDIKHSSYFEVYERLFNRYQNKPLVFIEIGEQNGGSLFMWRDYFAKQAQIISIDLNPEALRLKEYIFDIFISDQSNPEFWFQIVKKYPHNSA